MHSFPRRPPKPEQADRHAETPNHRTVQSMLRLHLPASLLHRLPMKSHVDDAVADDVRGDGETNTHTDGNEHKTVLVGSEAVDLGKGERH